MFIINTRSRDICLTIASDYNYNLSPFSLQLPPPSPSIPVWRYERSTRAAARAAAHIHLDDSPI